MGHFRWNHHVIAVQLSLVETQVRHIMLQFSWQCRRGWHCVRPNQTANLNIVTSSERSTKFHNSYLGIPRCQNSDMKEVPYWRREARFGFLLCPCAVNHNGRPRNKSWAWNKSPSLYINYQLLYTDYYLFIKY